MTSQSIKVTLPGERISLWSHRELERIDDQQTAQGLSRRSADGFGGAHGAALVLLAVGDHTVTPGALGGI